MNLNEWNAAIKGAVPGRHTVCVICAGGVSFSGREWEARQPEGCASLLVYLKDPDREAGTAVGLDSVIGVHVEERVNWEPEPTTREPARNTPNPGLPKTQRPGPDVIVPDPPAEGE